MHSGRSFCRAGLGAKAAYPVITRRLITQRRRCWSFSAGQFVWGWRLVVGVIWHIGRGDVTNTLGRMIERRGERCTHSSPRSVFNGNRPIPTALFSLGAAQAGQVAFAPNPALPTDQPLRGSWLNADVFFTPNSYQSLQPLLGRWLNTDVVLLQTRINHANRYSVDGPMQMLFYSKLASIMSIVTRQMPSMQMLFYSKLVSIMPIAARQLVQ